MKTVNFLEALEANKTKRVKKVGDEDWCSVNFLWEIRWLAKQVICRWVIESQPMEIWVNFWSDGTTTEYLTKKEAEHAARKINELASTSRLYYKIVKIVKFREVTDE